MKNYSRSIIVSCTLLIVVAVFLASPACPIFAQVSDGAAPVSPPADGGALPSTPGESASAPTKAEVATSSPVAAPAIGEGGVGSSPRPIGTSSPVVTPKTPPTPLPTPAPTPEPVVPTSTPPPSASTDAVPAASSSNYFLWAIVGLAAALGVCFGTALLLKNGGSQKKKGDTKDDMNCDEIKKRLDLKKQELRGIKAKTPAMQVSLDLISKEIEKIQGKIQDAVGDKLQEATKNRIFGANKQGSTSEHTVGVVIDEMAKALEEEKKLLTEKQKEEYDALVKGIKQAKEKYDDLMDKWEQAKNLLATAEKKQQNVADDIDTLENEYNVCVQNFETLRAGAGKLASGVGSVFKIGAATPEYFYHGSPKKDITVFEPRVSHGSGEKFGPLVYAAPDLATATIFLADWKKGATSGHFGDVPYVYIREPREDFIFRDVGGAVYVLPSATFQSDPARGMGEYEWASKVAVQPEKKIEFASALRGMLENGVQVYFVSEDMSAKIKASDDHGIGIMRSLTSENQREGVGVQRF